MIYVVSLFMASEPVSFVFMFIILAVCMSLSKIKPKTAFKGIRPIMFMLIFMTLLNIFFFGGETVIFQLGFIVVTREGVFRACYMAARMIMLIVGTFLLTYTTSPIALTDAIESLLNPLKKIKVPVHELAMMMSIALRFIPTLIEETDKIMTAQKSRGAAFDTGGLQKRAKAILPIIIPLFISAFRRADELAIAMESRCYSGGQGRTRMKSLKTTGSDYIALLLGFAVLFTVITFGRINIWKT